MLMALLEAPGTEESPADANIPPLATLPFNISTLTD